QLGREDGFSWAPVWSPDGRYVAYYSDDGSQAGIWIWEKAAGAAKRFPGVIPRPLLGFEVLRWSSDSRWILCKLLPDGMTIAEANALVWTGAPGERFPKTPRGQPSVIAFKSPQSNSSA